jgi:hypothetical protein
VLKAILAVTLSYDCLLEEVGKEQRLKIVTGLQAEVILYAHNNLSLQSLQAALIITNIYYGPGNFKKFWNMIAICKTYVDTLHLSETY